MRPSARLARAVAAERADLGRQRARLQAEAGDLRAALARLERGLAEIDERCALLDRLAPAGERAAPDAAGGGERRSAAAGGRAVLRGPAIREQAVRALLAHGGDALHYREWYELLTGDGFAVAGKDPLAVFLTQLSRSPAVRKGDGRGVYQLDRDAPARLRAALADLHTKLRELMAGGDLALIRTRRTQLTTEISRAERALEEVVRAFASGPSARIFTVDCEKAARVW